MSTRIKDLPFIDFYKVQNKANKKIQKVVFPNKVDIGVNNDLSSNLSIYGSLLLSGANLGNATSTANDIIIGNGSGSNGITFYSSPSGNAYINVHNGSDADRGSLRYDMASSPERWVFRTEGIDSVVIHSSSMFPASDQGLDLGGSSNRYSNIYSMDLTIGADTDTESDCQIVFEHSSSYEPIHLRWDSQAGTGRGGIRYSHPADSFFFRCAGMSENMFINNGVIGPQSNGGMELGGSSNRWETVYAQSGSFSDQVDGKLKHYIPFTFNYTGTGRTYLSWYSNADSTSIASDNVALTVVRPGRILNVALRSGGNVGTTVVSFHLNQSTTIVDSDSSSLTSGDRDVFEFSDAAEFDAGDEIHIGVNPTSAGSAYWGMVEFEYDTDGSVGF